MNNKIPRLAKFFLSRMYLYNSRHSIQGDFEESYNEIIEEEGSLKAKYWCWKNLIKSLPEHLKLRINWNLIMFGNYMKTGFRNIRKQKGYSVINISGLALGLAFCVLIYLYVQDELLFDKFHVNADSIYSLVQNDHYYESSGRNCPVPMGHYLENRFNEVKHSVSFCFPEDAVVRYGDRIHREFPAFTDPEIFRIFTFPLVRGNPETALVPENAVVLTKSYAAKYFGDEDPVGKTMTFTFGEKSRDFVVTGIADDVPGNSTIRFNILINIKNLDILYPGYLSNWENFKSETYLLLEKGTSPEIIERKLPGIIDENLAKIITMRRDRNWVDDTGTAFSFHLQNLKDMRFFSDHIRHTPKGSILTLYVLAGIALLILVVACINFINISIGRSTGRGKEIGIKKVLGADKKNLVGQFLSESVIVTAAAMICGLLTAYLLLPVFNDLSEKSLSFKNIFNLSGVSFFILLTITAGILSGLFPSLVMSNFKPVEIFKGRFRIGRKNLFTRALIIFQFSLSIFLIISTFLMTRQIRFMLNKDQGYKKEGVLIINTHERDPEKSESFVSLFKERASGYSDVLSVSGSWASFNRRTGFSSVEVNGERVPVHMNRVYYDYVNTMGMKLIEGRDFSREYSTDSRAVVVNRDLVQRLKLESPVGKTIKIGIQPEFHIIGVVEDFHFQSMREEIVPAVMNMLPNYNIYYALVRISDTDISGSLKNLEAVFKDIIPDKPFTCAFLDDDIELMYRNENKWNRIIKYSSIIALLITCMGITGLTSITISYKVKEIGIRKVLGASIFQIIRIITGDFILLIMAANIITWPVSFYILNKWLQGFAYKTEFGFGIFIASGLFVLFVALFMVSYQTAKAAVSNPVESLRYE
ncbi:ABC transporter permease [candidate division KSB1 bacterium]